MLRLGLASAFLVPAFLAGGTGVLPESALKCGPAAVGKEPLVFIDGELADGGTDEVDRKEILRVEIVCMDPRDSTFNRDRGEPAVSIWTRSGPASRLEPTLSAILEAQDAHLRSHSSYVRALDEIDLPERPAQIQLALDAGDDGWVATAWIERMLAKCFVFEGDVRAPHPSLSPREPECLSDRELRR